MKRCCLIISVCLLSTLTFPVQGIADFSKGTQLKILFDQRIPMSDGIQISANVFMPDDMEKPLPAVFVYTAYGIDGIQKDGRFFVEHDYVFLGVHCRGRGNSTGEFFPYEDAGRDGYEIVEWIAKQPWCDGQVAMIGLSYSAFTQWQTVKYLPPSLKSIIPSAPSCPGIDTPYASNILMSAKTQWNAVVAGKVQNWQLFRDMKYWYGKFYERYEKHIPFADLSKLTGTNTEWWRKWIEHPSYDDYWKSLSCSPEEFSKISIPILSITGYFDGDQRGTLHYYSNHMTYGNDTAKKKHHLIMGPWTHPGTRRNKDEHNGVKFGPKSVIYPDMIEFYVQWFDWVLKGKDKPDFLKNRVCYYVINENEWRYIDKLEDMANGTKSLFLSSQNGRANDVFHSGKLVHTPPEEIQQPDVFEYDPMKLMPWKDPLSYLQRSSNLDQSPAFADDKLIYHSSPLTESIEVAGIPMLKAYIELNVPDTDFHWRLYEIMKDGKVVSLGEGIMRARYRKSRSIPELVQPGDVNLYEINLYIGFVKRFDKGTRFRLIFTCMNTPHMQKNYNSGGDVSYETAKDARTAIVKLYHNKKYPSALVFPVKR